MKKVLRICAAVLLCTMILPIQTSRAAKKVNVIEGEEVQLRAGPGTKNKAIAVIPPGAAVELRKTPEWYEVRYTDADGKIKDGWLHEKSIANLSPEAALNKELNVEISVLKDIVAGFDREKAAFAQREKELMDKIAKVEASFQELKNGSSNYLKFKEEFDSTKANLSAAQDNIRSLIQENDNLKLAHRVQWFAAGAGVLVLGLMLGWFAGRRRKKDRPAYYY